MVISRKNLDENKDKNKNEEYWMNYYKEIRLDEEYNTYRQLFAKKYQEYRDTRAEIGQYTTSCRQMKEKIRTEPDNAKQLEMKQEFKNNSERKKLEVQFKKRQCLSLCTELEVLKSRVNDYVEWHGSQKKNT